MRAGRTSPGRSLAGPVPVRAGASLLVHDLKNLAGRLSTLCQNLDAHYADPHFKRSALSVLDATVLHLRRLAGDLREHEDRVIIKLRVDLSHILAEALGDAGVGHERGVVVTETYEPLPLIWGDSYLLRRAFACAIENSVQAMEGRGTLSLRTACLKRGGRPRVVVEIADNGPGMSEEFIRETLFVPFSTTKENGTGLGAYTIRQVAALHGGTVRVRSAYGVGTRLRFHFPAGEE